MAHSVQANLALVRRTYELWNRGGPEPLVEHVWPEDVVFHESPEMPDTGVFRGVEAVAGRMRELVELAGHFQMNLCSIEGRGDYVLAACDMSVEGAITGLRQRKRIFHVFRCRGGLVREFRAHFDARRARCEYEGLTGGFGRLRSYESPMRFSSSAISLRSAFS
jgi:ketosteroid isomerase-like protein